MKNNKLNKKAISGFYTAFQKNNAEGMIKYYHDDIEFEDPAFGKLKGDRAKNMWRMLSEVGKGNIKVTYKNIHIDGDKGSAEWEAIYNFSETGREVHNKVKANFEFKDGLIYKHIDSFDLWAWSKMALGGFTGYVLGFTPIFKNKLNIETNKKLDQFIEKRQAQGLK
ncbi:MAG: nuclear transport factor 2 family protein [Candidatus Sericytochromatia bacterium]|nr:nuclear transport factor 2 family protein [Candidatus Sericytochromatia bacterium]